MQIGIKNVKYLCMICIFDFFLLKQKKNIKNYILPIVLDF